MITRSSSTPHGREPQEKIIIIIIYRLFDVHRLQDNEHQFYPLGRS